MLPPQAPPAHVNHANQSAVATLQRMQETQAWLLAQQDALPDIPSHTDERDTLLADLDTFWETPIEHAPGEPFMPRRQVLARRLAQAARDDASLRRNDGTLADEAVETISWFVAHRGDEPLPGHVRALEFFAGDAPCAGTVVLENARDPGRVLYFSVETGWQAFRSLDELYREVALDLRGGLDPDAAPDTPFLTLRPVEGDAFDVLARRLVARTRDRVAGAFDSEGSVVSLPDRLYPVLDLSTLLDVHGMVRQRDLALAARTDEERLARQPDRVRDHWRQSASAYRDAWRQERDAIAVPSLAWFAETELSMALRDRGIEVPPQELGVRIVRRVPDSPVSQLISGFPHEDLPLTALAYRNIGNLATEHLQAIREDGSVREDVPAEVLREIVRELDLPTRYARYLDELLGNSVEGRSRRASHHALQAARMRFEAADARLAYFDRTEPRSFQDDHQERGFHWVQAVLDHPSPSGRRKIDGHEIVVHQLTYQGAPLSGVFLLSARQSEAVRRVVLYTPDAPDGVAFREFGDRSELTREFLLDPRFEGYLLDRLPLAFAAFDEATGMRHFATSKLNGDRDLKWVLSLPGCNPRGACTQLAERFQEREVTGSYLDADYDVSLQLAQRNAADLARTTARADWDSVFDVWGWNVPFHLVKEFVAGTVKSLPHAAQAGWRFYDHVKAGDGTGAFLAFVEGYTAGLGALPLYTQVPLAAGARMRAAPGSRTLTATGRTLPASDTLFEKRFLARGIAAPSGRKPASGVYTIDGNRYVRQGGAMYHVRFDPDIAGWRLSRPGALDARASGPAIERLADGQWRFRRVGLLGGSGRKATLATMLEEVKDILEDPSRLAPEVAALTDSQRVVLIAELRRNLRLGQFVGTLRDMVDREVNPELLTTPARRRIWDAAIAKARRTSPTAPPLTLAQALGTPEPGPSGQPASSLGPTPGPSTSSGRAPQTSAPTPSLTDVISASLQLSARGLSNNIPAKYWPEFAYVYLPRDALALQAGQRTVTLPQLRFAGAVQGVPLTTLPPDTPMSAVPRGAVAMPSRVMASAADHTLGSFFGGWIKIDMQQLSFRRTELHRTFRMFAMAKTERRGYLLRKVIDPGTKATPIYGEDPISLFPNEFVIGFHQP